MDRSLSTSAEQGAPQAKPVIPRPASTVIVVRDGPDGRPETFMVRRDPNSRFAADAFVFPGGAVQDEDHLAGGVPPCSGLTIPEAHRRLTERGGEAPDEPGLSLALHGAAVRELFEEAGILLARDLGADATSSRAGEQVQGLARTSSADIAPEVTARLANLRPDIQA